MQRERGGSGRLAALLLLIHAAHRRRRGGGLGRSGRRRRARAAGLRSDERLLHSRAQVRVGLKGHSGPSGRRRRDPGRRQVPVLRVLERERERVLVREHADGRRGRRAEAHRTHDAHREAGEREARVLRERVLLGTLARQLQLVSARVRANA